MADNLKRLTLVGYHTACGGLLFSGVPHYCDPEDYIRHRAAILEFLDVIEECEPKFAPSSDAGFLD